jgi:hypothetical protein
VIPQTEGRKGIIRDLSVAVDHQDWPRAFRLARELNRSQTASADAASALKSLAREAIRYLEEMLPHLNKPVLQRMLVELRRLSRDSVREFYGGGKGGGEVLDMLDDQNDEIRIRLEDISRHMREFGALKRATKRTSDKKATSNNSGTSLFHRVPHMWVQPVGTQEEYVVTVFADMTPPDRGSLVENIRARVPRHLAKFEIAVSLDCSAHFAINGPGRDRLVFWRDRPESDFAQFLVSLTNPRNPEPMYVRALFHYNGRPSGKITRFVNYNVKTKRLSWARSRSRKRTSNVEHVMIPNDVPTSNISCDFNASSSDIRIEVLKTAKNDGRTFKLRCYTPVGDWKGLWVLDKQSDEFVREHMSNFVEADSKNTLATLQGAGIEFWNSVTKDARNCLTRAFESCKIRTISILSEEPFVPWELMIPIDIGLDPVPCLGVAYSMGRWITGDFRSPSQALSMKTAFIVAPEQSGLDLAKREAAFLKKLLPGSSQIKPVSFSGLDRSLRKSKHDVVHFICHGEGTGTPTLRLDPEDVVTASQVISMKGFLTAFRMHPFAFLNSCEVGRPVRNLAGIGGFANSFLRMGAAGVVAPLWSIDDTVAEKACKIFYRKVLAGKTIGEAMQNLRSQAFRLGVETYASYCYYGDPGARVRSTRQRTRSDSRSNERV